MGRLYLEYSLDDSVYICRSCGTHLTTPKLISSKVNRTTRSHSYSRSMARPEKHISSITCKFSQWEEHPWMTLCLIHTSEYRLNCGSGPAEERVLSTGLHVVRDIYCKQCLTIVGWSYVSSTFITELSFLELFLRAAVVPHYPLKRRSDFA